MNLREGILDALVDDGESIVQIVEYLNYLKIKFDTVQVIKQLEQLLIEEKIRIEYPPDSKGLQQINRNKVGDYWFELNQIGREEWGKIDQPS